MSSPFYLSCYHFIYILLLLLFLYCFSAEMMTFVGFGWKQSQERCSPFSLLRAASAEPSRHPASISTFCTSKILSWIVSDSGLFTQPACMCHYNSVIWRGQQKSSHQCQCLRYRYGPGNKWPNAQAAEQTINKAISCVITAALFLKPTFQNFSLCKSLQPHHQSPAL